MLLSRVFLRRASLWIMSRFQRRADTDLEITEARWKALESSYFITLSREITISKTPVRLKSTSHRYATQREHTHALQYTHCSSSAFFFVIYPNIDTNKHIRRDRYGRFSKPNHVKKPYSFPIHFFLSFIFLGAHLLFVNV